MSLKKEHTFIDPSLMRQPSTHVVGKRNNKAVSRLVSGNRSPNQPLYLDSPPSYDSTIASWGWEDILHWIAGVGLDDTREIGDVFKEQRITKGAALLRLEESHLKEMGVVKIGDRVLLLEALEELRTQAGLVDSRKYISVDMLMDQLDSARARRYLQMYPKRLILIRHGESQGNVDSSKYATVPDCKLPLTDLGIQQAKEVGKSLQDLLSGETVSFYVSPFMRSRMTYEYIRESFHDEQVLYYREDPRIREQEWGNFQDPEEVAESMAKRREIGAFYFRFPTGESGADVFDRVSTFLETLYRDMQKGMCGDNAVIVSHGLFCRLFLTRFYHWTVEKFHKLWNFKNCQYCILELQAEGYYKLITELKSD